MLALIDQPTTRRTIELRRQQHFNAAAFKQMSQKLS